MNSSTARKWNKTQNSPEINKEHQEQKQTLNKKMISREFTKVEKYLYIIVSVVLVLASAYVVSFSSKTDTMNRELQTFQGEIENQQLINEGLTFEVKELSQPDRITKIAKNKGLKIQDAEVKKVNVVND